MQKEEIILKLKTLGFPKNSYVVFGSCPMTMAGLRAAKNIDLLVSKELFEKLRQDGWQEVYKNSNDKPLAYGVFEAHDNWNFSSYSPSLEQLLVSASVIDDIPFASLEEVRKWKVASGRPKDLADIQLIDRQVIDAEQEGA